MIHFGIAELYCGPSGKSGFYNSQEVGLARAMKKRGYSCFIFYPAPGQKETTEEQVEENIRIIRCPAKNVGVHAVYDWSILKKYGISILQIDADNQLFAPGLIHYCEKNKILFYTYSGTAGSDSGNAVKKILMHALFLRNVRSYRQHKNFVKTERVRDAFLSFGIKDVSVAPVGLDTQIIPTITKPQDQLREERFIPKDCTAVLFVGRLDPYKQPENFVMLMEQLPDNYYGVMIGNGSLAEHIGEVIRNMGLEQRMRWIKAIPNEEIHAYYKACDFFVNLNAHEIFGMSILEAMYQGCTTVAMHAPGPDMILEDGVSGYLANNLDEMKKILTTRGRLQREVVRKRITDCFTWEKAASLFDEWIKGI